MSIRVSGGTIKSLRQRYKMNVAAAAHVTGVEEQTLSEWEQDGVEMTLTQAKSFAKKFNTHWSVLLLETPVQKINTPVNNRAGYSDNARFSIQTYFAYEAARRILDSSIEIEGQVVDPSVKGKCSDQDKIDAKYCARVFRELLNVNYDSLRKVRADPRDAYVFWREAISSLGVYVSEQSMPVEETKAFLLEDGPRAIIVINRNDRYPHSKVFSLLHELGHLVKGDDSAACDIKMYAHRVSAEETWCNQFASEMILPDEELLADARIAGLKDAAEPADVIRQLSSHYRAGFTVIMYKLLKHERITDDQLKEMKAFFKSVILPKFSPKPDSDIKLGKIYHVRRDLAKASPALSREVIDRQLTGAVPYSDVPRLLGTKARYVEDIKGLVGFGQ